jgi:uncharacterized membrane protein YphA (DoxX/SURF4 family)
VLDRSSNLAIVRCARGLPRSNHETGQPRRHESGIVTFASLKGFAIDDPDGRLHEDRTATRVAIVAGVIFFFAGLVKFAFHHWELHAFRSFGLPFPYALEIFAGVIETVGGVLLVLRRCVMPVATLLSATMLVAIISSGIGHGDVIPSLTLAPALLVAMLYLLAVSRSPTHERQSR